jgi:hypothetical protein
MSTTAARWLAGLAVLVATQAHCGSCFMLYAPSGKMVLQTQEPIIDLSRSISEETARKFPGHQVIVAPAHYCPEIDLRPPAQGPAKLEGNGRTPSDSPALALAQPIGSDGGLLPSTEPYASGYGSRHQAGRDVRVRTYERRDGTVVRGHTRAAPGRGSRR